MEELDQIAGEPPYAVPPPDPPVEDCFFYHAMEIPGHGFVGGGFDLRGHEDEYLGGVDLDGRRVLEIGPASGFLTFHMEDRGAHVVAVDLPEGSRWDLVPHSGVDGPSDEWLTAMRQMKNGFWFAHRRRRSSAKVLYGSAYDLPDELGSFDIGLMEAVAEPSAGTAIRANVPPVTSGGVGKITS